MITSQDIKKYAECWYGDFLKASLKGEGFFPRDVRFGKVKASDTLKDFQEIRSWIQSLRSGSKEQLGYGYVIEYVKRKDRGIGEQYFPQRIFFKNEDDYLMFIKKQREYHEFKISVKQITNAVPELFAWVLDNPLKVIEQSGKWADMMKVCKYFIATPRPNLYIRELPIDVHTKFIEENKAILRQILDFLIEEYINKDETEFEKRFNLKYSEPLIRIKILDSKTAETCFSRLTDMSIVQSEFNSMNVVCKRVFILENKTNFSNLLNFLTLPALQDSIAIFGKGFQLGLLKDAIWLHDKQIIYWGDIDIHGFQMLSQLRLYFPMTQSLMMDMETFNEFRAFRVAGTYSNVNKLPNLTKEEDELFNHILDLKEDNRLEQEKIAHNFVVKKIMKLMGSQ